MRHLNLDVNLIGCFDCCASARCFFPCASASVDTAITFVLGGKFSDPAEEAKTLKQAVKEAQKRAKPPVRIIRPREANECSSCSHGRRWRSQSVCWLAACACCRAAHQCNASVSVAAGRQRTKNMHSCLLIPASFFTPPGYKRQQQRQWCWRRRPAPGQGARRRRSSSSLLLPTISARESSRVRECENSWRPES